ncbi:type I toxin-antitoxin system toxin Ldr family protein [Escherichia coli]|nr:type I toxin-antitoxin system toxin Ldr family protein [Escherichia coli]
MSCGRQAAVIWHDLAAPVIAGILASMIVNWLNKRK